MGHDSDGSLMSLTHGNSVPREHFPILVLLQISMSNNVNVSGWPGVGILKQMYFDLWTKR